MANYEKVRCIFFLRFLNMIPLTIILATGIMVYIKIELNQYLSIMFNDTQEWDLFPIEDV
jgi:hypothetical protein